MGQPLGPTRESERIVSLDVVRGIAIFGILPVNLVSFGLPMQGGMEKPYLVASGSGEAAAFLAVHALFAFKFITLFSLLFGVGMGLQQERAEQRGTRLGGRYIWRNVLLIGIGLVHGLVLWYGDILFWYGVVGIVLCGLAAIPKKTQLLLGLASLCIPVALAGLIGLALIAAPDLPKAPTAPDTIEAALKDPHLENARIYDMHPGREVLTYREGTYLDALALRAFSWVTLFVIVLFFYVWRVIGLFLLGMAVHRHGLFKDPARHRTLLRRLIVFGVFVGLPLECALAFVKLLPDVSPAVTVLLEAVHHVSSLMMTLGIVAFVLYLPLVLPRSVSALKPLASAGRMALTNYLGQTVVGITIFYSYGFGQFGQISRAGLWRLWFGIVLAQLVLSVLWLQLFRFGPVEWAWRSLTFLKLQPMLKRQGEVR